MNSSFDLWPKSRQSHLRPFRPKISSLDKAPSPFVQETIAIHGLLENMRIFILKPKKIDNMLKLRNLLPKKMDNYFFDAKTL